MGEYNLHRSEEHRLEKRVHSSFNISKIGVLVDIRKKLRTLGFLFSIYTNGNFGNFLLVIYLFSAFTCASSALQISSQVVFEIQRGIV